MFPGKPSLIPARARLAMIAVWAGLLTLQAGCSFLQFGSSGSIFSQSRPVETNSTRAPQPAVTETSKPAGPLLASDSPSETTPGDAPTPVAPLRADAILTVVRIRVPTSQRERLSKVWD